MSGEPGSMVMTYALRMTRLARTGSGSLPAGAANAGAAASPAIPIAPRAAPPRKMPRRLTFGVPIMFQILPCPMRFVYVRRLFNTPDEIESRCRRYPGCSARLRETAHAADSGRFFPSSDIRDRGARGRDDRRKNNRLRLTLQTG